MEREVRNTRVAVHVHVHFEWRWNGIKEVRYKVFRTLSFYDIPSAIYAIYYNVTSKDR